MLVATAVFLFVTVLVVGGYAAATASPGLVAGRRLEQRLRDLRAAPPGVIDASVIAPHEAASLPALDRLVKRTGAGVRLARLVQQSGVRTTAGRVVVLSVLTGLISASLAHLTIRQPFAPLVAAVLGVAAPYWWLSIRRTRRLRRFEEQFPDALDLLSRALRAGHAFQTALGMVAEELPAPVGSEFRMTFEQQNFGLPLRDALNELAGRVGILDARFFVTAVAIQRDTGGNLAEILDNLAHVVRERFKIRRQVRVHTAHGRFTGYVLLALPVALAIALSFISPDHMTLLLHERMGHIMLAGAAVMQGIGLVWIRQVIRIEV